MRASRAAPRGLDKAVLVGFAGVASGFALMGLVMNLFTQVVVGMYFYALAGLAVAVLRSRDHPDLHVARESNVLVGGRSS